ncbi:alanine dehydrogenase [Sanguibacter sp. HDW7]|uniref:alanine dehydrogenase n=1 Tax=Sanguibacter sp. HDW7 TaxID=2714931 RepID=UPI00140CBA92|nr:alanine dehydrogenase [Sanguibacter sp. HDW7]QIK84225.1 alanine dehydrogenase [Sanguibacter sp. HDW7]
MRIGVPTETKTHEYRVACTPGGVHALVAAGHEVLVEAGAGAGSAMPDDEYVAAGATVVADAAEVWERAELVCKVKEPTPAEHAFLRPGLELFTYLHAAADLPLTRALLDHRVTSYAYETVTGPTGGLPLLAPMSEIAGRLAAQVGAVELMRSRGGRGILMGGVPGTPPAKVVVLGGGTVGRNAAQIALGMRADVTVVDVSPETLRAIDTETGGHVRTAASNAWEIEPFLLEADLVVGAVLVPGARTPHLVSDALVARMREGSVLVDVAIDQGGCFEVSHPTTHDDPVYQVHGSRVYAVANMPGAVPVTSTRALTNATLPYLLELASGTPLAVGADDGDHGPRRASLRAGLRAGLTTSEGLVRHVGVADAHGLPLATL